MTRHTCLQSARVALPGTLLAGWAPGRPAARTIQLVVRDLAAGTASRQLRQGAELGLDDVSKGAGLLRRPLVVDRLRGEVPSALRLDHAAVEVIVAGEDDRHPCDDSPETRPRIYTCPLRTWRPDAWSVASRVPFEPADEPGLDWHPALASPGAAQLNARFARRAGTPMDEDAWRGWMAVKVAFEVALRADAGEDDLLVLQFDGHKGAPLHFSEDGHLVQPTVRLVDGHARLAAPLDADAFFDGQ